MWPLPAAITSDDELSNLELRISVPFFSADRIAFFLKRKRCYGKAGCGGLARNSRAAACARVEHHRGASSEAPLRDYMVLGD